MFIWQNFFKIAPHNGAMNYFDSATGNDILSVHQQIGGGEDSAANYGEVC